MSKTIIDTFWKNRSATGKGRWTDDTLLSYEVSWLSQYVKPETKILDLGSGPGELSSQLLPTNGTLTLVEKYPDFLKMAPVDSRIQHVLCDVLDFTDHLSYDLILLFGVVTHLSEQEEEQVYRLAAKQLSADGTFVVKNQVSLTGDKIVSGYSPQLQGEYWGRYPALDHQYAQLEKLFRHIEIIHYPDQFNPWSDTKHVAFVCG